MAESHGAAKGQKTGAHTEADGGHGGKFPPFDSSTFASQLVSLVIAFVALYLIVSRIALPRVGSMLDERQAAIEGDLAEAQKLKDESDAELKAYENELAAARARAHAISAETREAAMRNVRGIAADAAAAIVQRLTGVQPDGKTTKRAVDSSLKG